jgi:MmyB-like transcription regulator ligand binding domain
VQERVRVRDQCAEAGHGQRAPELGGGVGLRLLAVIESWPVKKRNVVRFVLLHPAAPELFADCDAQVRDCVARLRALAGTDPDAPALAHLLGELLLQSPEFARLWERFEVKGCTSHGRKTFHHPSVGDLTLGYQGTELDGTPGHRMIVYYAEPGTPDRDAMMLDLALHQACRVAKSGQR